MDPDQITPKLQSTWMAVLGVETALPSDNFFDVGGDSLLLVELSDEVSKSLGVDISFADFFRAPTFGALIQQCVQALSP